ncbi:MAG: hypothetical protein ACQES1_05420 [Bacteroidota bacterium]
MNTIQYLNQEKIMQQQDNIQFRLEKINTEQFALIEEEYNKNNEIKVGVNFKFAVNHEKQMLAVFSEFNYESAGSTFIKLAVSCHFKIPESNWVNFLKEETIVVPQGLLRHLSVITVGTARGVLHEKTVGTRFNNFILPFIDLTKVITQDMTFKVNGDQSNKD